MDKLINLEKIKMKWQSLHSRERLYLSVAIIFIVLVFLYYVLLSPLVSSVQHLRQQVNQQQSLVAWMQPRVKALQGTTTRTVPIQTVSQNELLPTIDTRLKQSSFAAAVTEISQTNNNNVRITFEKVSFDDLMAWLAVQWKTSHIAVSDVDVQKGENPGIVQVTLTLTVKA